MAKPARAPKAQQRTEDEQIIQEAKDRFRRCREWESDFRKLFIEDLKFANADSDNGWAWPDSIRKNREIDDRPCLTINKTKQHCLQVINDGRQHAPQIKVHPISGGATVEAAKLLDGIVRHVEYRSNAQSAYNTGQEFAVFGGIGYWRITTEYENDESFDQDIRIQRVKDPLSIHLDPDIKELDGSDAKFGFVFRDMTKDDYEHKYGSKAVEEAWLTLGEGPNSDWIGKDHIRVCEYFRVKPTTEKIAALSDEMLEQYPGAKSNIIKQGDVTADEWAQIVGLAKNGSVKMRSVEKREVQWFLLAGEKIKERSIWPGKYIPIIRVVGEEIVIDGKLERKGHVRTLKDPQRMYNYWSSSATEQVALQTKSPYIAAAEAVEGYEDYWKKANTDNFSYLPYNSIDDNGNPVQRPQREQPPVMASAYVEGMKIAAGEMMMVSGQYQAVMGQQGNETSGVAISARQRQGDNATYHYIDHLSLSIRFTGRVIVDLIPKVYDTPRVLRILGEDGVEDFIHIDPSAPQPLQQQQMQQRAMQQGQMKAEIKQILNPAIGAYDVVVDVGPAYATRRQEAFAALSQIMGQNSELMQKAGDLLFKAADFPMAQDIAERLNRAIPPALKGEGPAPEVMQAQQTIQQLQHALKITTDAMAKLRSDTDAASQRADADTYRAETERAQALHNAAMDQQKFIHDIALAVTQMQQKAEPPPKSPMQTTSQPAPAGFFTPEGAQQ